ncbi:MAG: hypothetical protein ACJ0GY_02225 [Synechococcus sp.]|nr:MAG: hypothetical protein DBW82_01975 [Synechococcus sp. MED-G68]|tara:strand:+ start:352 stop:696 length:345 start_codon:yes stop_codon:yes gene_type:complete
MPSPKPIRIVPSRSLERFVGRWLVAIPVALAPAWLSAELFRLPAGRVCAVMNRSLQEQVSGSVAKRLQQDCRQATDESVNLWLLWLIWALLIRSSYRYWPLLVAMVVEGEKHDF